MNKAVITTVDRRSISAKHNTENNRSPSIPKSYTISCSSTSLAFPLIASLRLATSRTSGKLTFLLIFNRNCSFSMSFSMPLASRSKFMVKLLTYPWEEL
uniref:Uncharacterized protein n=1 Tax=Megaselia scalaris TaxID=36166 RepID=T1GZR0_MEGSC